MPILFYLNLITYPYTMKPLYLITLLIGLGTASRATVKFVSDTSKHDDTTRKKNVVFEKAPAYPGGLQEFYKYISNKLKYPEVAQLIGIDGKVFVSFVIDKDGRVTEVTPVKCLGAGCDAAAVDVLQQSQPWAPGILDGRPVRVQYTVPITFSIKKNDGIVQMKDLRRSDYGFIFQINGNTYTIDEAEGILGKKFQSDQVAEAVPYEGTEKYQMPDKKAVYVIVIKS